jgi:hypothetical protein
LRGLEEKLNEKDIYKIIAKNIRKERIKNNLTLEELSEKHK